MQSLFYNKMLTSSCNLLNTILKVEKQDQVYVCGSVALYGQKVENYKANYTPRNGCTLYTACLRPLGCKATRAGVCVG